MSFTERQQHCLEAMGLVAWVPRNPSPEALLEAPTEDTLKPTSSEGHILSSSLPADPGKPVEMPGDKPGGKLSAMPSHMKELAAWLPEQPLANFGYKGSTHTTLGHPEASVLIVVQRPGHGQAQNNGEQNHSELPLAGDAAQLFELMMRSIGLGRSDVRQCALASGGVAAHDLGSVEQSVSTACTPHTRVILVLLAMEDSLEVSADAHHCRLARSQLPVWRIAHPDMLLQENHRKRQAWQALKALQHYLAV